MSSTDFVRGDANGDGELNIADAVAALGQLFLGDPASPTCPEALDANDDGALDLSDPVSVLEFLFLGRAALPAPFPEPGPCPVTE